MTQVYRVPAVNYPKLVKEIDRLNGRALRMCFPTMQLKILETINVTNRNEVVGFDYEDCIHLCVVEGEMPKKKGWNLIAKVEPTTSGNNLVKELPDQYCPIEFRSAAMRCDHCGVIRRRSAVYVLRHTTGKYTQVGRQCLADFLGHKDPEVLLSQIDNLAAARFSLGESQRQLFGRDEPHIPIEEFVIVVAVAIRQLGWTARSGVRHKPPTADIAWNICIDPEANQSLVKRKKLYATEDDIQKATDAIAWAKKIDSHCSSTFLYDLGICCRELFVDRTRSGFVASVINAHQKHLAYLETKKSDGSSQHLGKEGERLEVQNVRVVSMTDYMANQYPMTLIKFSDPNGNILVWRASGKHEWAKIGETVSIKGTVKKHTVEANIAETVLQRVLPLGLDATIQTN